MSNFPMCHYYRVSGFTPRKLVEFPLIGVSERDLLVYNIEKDGASAFANGNT